MKSTKLSKFAALFAAVGLFTTSMVPYAGAAKITELPYSDDYNSYADETHKTSFENALGNTGVTWFYLPGTVEYDDTLSLCNDDDANSGHGKVVKYVNNTPLANTRIQYRFPKQESGKVAIQYDIKVNNNSCGFSVVPCTTAYSEWTGSMMKFKNNSVSFYTNTETAFYTFSEWNTVTHIIDIDKGEQTTYYKGNTYVTTVPNLSELAAITFYWHSKEDVKDPEKSDIVYIDNMTIAPVSDGVSAALYTEDGKAIQDVAPAVNKLLIKISDGIIDSVPDVVVTDLGNQIIKSSTPVVISEKKLTAEGIEITLENNLELGHNYSVSLPDNLMTKFMQEISNKNMTFTCSKMSETFTEDFSGLTSENMNTPAVGTVVYEGSQFKFYTADAAGYEVLTDSSYTGGKALKLTKKNSAIYVPVPTQQIKTGILKLNGHIISDAENYTVVQMFYNTAATVPLLQFKNLALQKYLHQANEEVYGKQSVPNSVYKDGVSGDVQFEMDMNFNDLSVPSAKVLTDGKEYTWTIDSPRMPHRSTNASNPVDIMDTGVKFLKIVTNSTTVIDTFGYEYIPDKVAVVKDVTFIAPDDTEVSYSEGAALPSGTKAMKVKFSDAMKLSSLGDIKVANSKGRVKCTAEATEEENTYLLTFEKPLHANAEYRVTIPETVVTEANLAIYNPVSEKITTGEGIYTVSNLRITDADGNALTDLKTYEGNTVKVKVNVVNSTGIDKNVALLLGGFNGLKLYEVGFGTPEVAGIYDGDVEISVELEDKSELEYIKAFAFESMDNIKPLLKAVKVPETVK